jgi:hypothetical protein
MKIFKSFIFSFTMIMLLTSCSTSVKDYANEKPAFQIDKFFNGRLTAHGFLKDRKGFVSKRFVVKMNATWKGNVGTLNEDFVYSDGTKQNRVWTLTKLSDTKVKGTAADVVGEALGEISGNTLYWTYVLDLKVGDKNYKVNLKDWMYLIDENTVLNQSYMSKFGLDVGEIVLSMKKEI